MNGSAKRAADALRALAGEPECVWAAPGRVNLIGDHVDYHGGLVCPIAIDRHTVAAARQRSDRVVRVVSAERAGVARIDLDAPASPSGSWTDYVEGVARALEAGDVRLSGADLAIASDLPIGAGLSSSAALEMAAGAALLTISAAPLDLGRLAAAGRTAENGFVGVSSGAMDQLAVTFARAGHALDIDCSTLTVTPVPLPDEAAWIVADSGVRHALAGSGYNDRRRESDAAAGALGVRLRDATPAGVESANLTVLLRSRARHIVSEIARVRAFENALRRGDLADAGAQMLASHASLRDDYDVSVPELDRLVERAARLPGVHGARMTGGGFGGSVVVLAEAECAAAVATALDARQVRAVGGLHALIPGAAR